MDGSFIIFLALVVQAITGTCVYIKIRANRTRYLGFLFLCVLLTYHGLTEIVQWFFPGRDRYRDLVAPKFVDQWMILITLAIVIYGITYYYFLRLRTTGESKSGPVALARIFNWRVWLPLGILLRGVSWISGSWEASYWISGIIFQYDWLPILVGVAGLVIDRPRSWQTPLLLFFCGFMTLGASRFLVIGSAVSVIFFLTRLDRPMRARSLLVILTICFVFGLLISKARSIYGREAILDSTKVRIGGFVQSALEFGHNDPTNDYFLDDIVYRFDANSVAAFIMEAIDSGKHYGGFGPLYSDIVLCIPSFITRSKLETAVTSRSDKAFLSVWYGLPPDMDLIVGLFGTLYGCFGSAMVLGGAVMFGMLFSWLDNRLVVGQSTVHTLIFLGFLESILFYEQNTNGYAIHLRSVIVVIAVCIPIERIFGLESLRHGMWRSGRVSWRKESL